METIKDKAFRLLQKCQVVTFATTDDDGFPRPVPVAKIREERPFVAWFATGTSSEKVKHLRRDDRAGLSFFDGDDSVTLTGRAEAVVDPGMKRAMWQDWFIDHFPGGADDPDYCLVKFTAQQGVFYIDGEFVKLPAGQI